MIRDGKPPGLNDEAVDRPVKKAVVVKPLFCVFEKVFCCFFGDVVAGPFPVVKLKKKCGLGAGCIDIELNDSALGRFVAETLGDFNCFAFLVVNLNRFESICQGLVL